MKLYYIYHSGFLLEMDKCYILFDYFKKEIPELKPDKHLYVLSSHSHPDHFRNKVFDIYRDRGNVDFILSDDIEPKRESDRDMAHFVSANESYEIGDLKIRTLESTDLGLAFMLEVEGKKIYHSGDLNWWTWHGYETEEEYEIMTDRFKREIGKIEGEDIDLAMLVLDHRQGDRYDWGMKYFLENTKNKYVVPMHCWDKFEVIDRFKRDNKDLVKDIHIINTPDAIQGIEIDL